MDRLQILFPSPQLSRLRRIAREQDRPVSELIRAAVDSWLERHEPWTDRVAAEPPRFHCGEVLADGDELRAFANSDRVP